MYCKKFKLQIIKNPDVIEKKGFQIRNQHMQIGYLWVICHHFFSPGIKLLFIPHPVHSLAILQERQCTLKGQARYVNVRGSVHCKGVYRVGDKYLVKKSGDR